MGRRQVAQYNAVWLAVRTGKLVIVSIPGNDEANIKRLKKAISQRKWLSSLKDPRLSSCFLEFKLVHGKLSIELVGIGEL